jgi:glycosidase
MTNSSALKEYFPYSVQIRRSVWERLALADAHRDIRSANKPKIIFYREMAARLATEGRSVLTGELNLYALQMTIQRHIVSRYLHQQCPEILPGLLQAAGVLPGSAGIEKLAATFCRLFPGEPFIDNPTLDPADWLSGSAAAGDRLEMLVAEILILSVAVSNRAIESFRDVVDWQEFVTATSATTAVAAMEQFLAAAPPLTPAGLTLPDFLRLPQKVAPASLYEQLRFMKEHWQLLLPAEILPEIMGAFALVEEEGRRFMVHGAPGGAPVLEFGPGSAGPGTNDFYPEPERFSADTDWMPNVVLLAKMVYVWLGQLSKKYGEAITRLDQIPDAELDTLAGWGITGLWLIGLWERSPASQQIKRLCGNPEAISSAYSLFDYTIAADLGGEEALWQLRERALKRGIRLASDMVPNHTGIFSKWAVEHPDWFIQLDYPPYPAYRFTGVDLSSSPDVSLHIEDGYWERRDAAVVFKHYDHRSGRTRYIYHGNDGSSTPWNDTAQLNYLIPEVREAVTNTILHVARMFPIIRFDAAMTLAKKHYQRLWFPQPGHGGVPSRAEYGMTREQFDAAMPEEFWRQVVDRIAADAPDTLLLAEAFWLMEGYFVRTLGMHRVYNSAFMNMLKMEENAKYRQTIRNVLEFNPQVLQRFVNFMNNPDEKTAVEQFGRESKYIGATVLLVTMPGLPMIGHGQIEGFHEKYGMEYKKAYWDEPVDEHLVREHERRIFPLMRRRWLFSGAEHFRLYDFNGDGHHNENVFAYSNRAGAQRALIFYHNRFATAAGWIRQSTPYAVKNGDGEMTLASETVGSALALKGDGRHYYVYRDYADGCEYLRNGRELCNEGFFVRLEAYDYHVYLDFREIWDDDYGTWGKLCQQLEGRGVASIDEEMKQIRYAVLIDQLRSHLERSRALLTGEFAGLLPTDLKREKEKFVIGQQRFFTDLAQTAGLAANGADLLPALLTELGYLEEAAQTEGSLLGGETAQLLAFAWLILHRSGELTTEADPAVAGSELVGTFGLARPLEEELGGEATDAGDRLAQLDIPAVMALFSVLLRWQRYMALAGAEQTELLPQLLADRGVSRFIALHKSGGYQWFIRERWELLLEWLELVSLAAAAGDGLPAATVAAAAARKRLLAAAAVAGYRLDLVLAGAPC